LDIVVEYPDMITTTNSEASPAVNYININVVLSLIAN